jgi:hypothetical protein
MLTLYTTPVIYLWFERLARRFAGNQPHEAEILPEHEPA